MPGVWDACFPLFGEFLLHQWIIILVTTYLSQIYELITQIYSFAWIASFFIKTHAAMAANVTSFNTLLFASLLKLRISEPKTLFHLFIKMKRRHAGNYPFTWKYSKSWRQFLSSEILIRLVNVHGIVLRILILPELLGQASCQLTVVINLMLEKFLFLKW